MTRFNDNFVKTLKLMRWRDLQLADKNFSGDALERLAKTQAVLSAIEAVRSEPEPSPDDLSGTDFVGDPLDPKDDWFQK